MVVLLLQEHKEIFQMELLEMVMEEQEQQTVLMQHQLREQVEVVVENKEVQDKQVKEELEEVLMED